MKNLFLIVIALLIFSCDKTDKNSPVPKHINAVNLPVTHTEKSIDELWSALLFEKSSCLIGSGYYNDHKISDEYGQVTFKRKPWKSLKAKDKNKVANFLLNKLTDSTITRVHNCPNVNATQGEMTIYALQHLSNKNWWDFDDFAHFKDNKTRDVGDHPQIWLQKLLRDTVRLELLSQLYRKELNL